MLVCMPRSRSVLLAPIVQDPPGVISLVLQSEPLGRHPRWHARLGIHARPSVESSMANRLTKTLSCLPLTHGAPLPILKAETARGTRATVPRNLLGVSATG